MEKKQVKSSTSLFYYCDVTRTKKKEKKLYILLFIFLCHSLRSSPNVRSQGCKERKYDDRKKIVEKGISRKCSSPDTKNESSLDIKQNFFFLSDGMLFFKHHRLMSQEE